MVDDRIRLDPEFIKFLRVEAANNGFSSPKKFSKYKVELLKKKILIGDTEIEKKNIKKFQFKL